MLTFSEYIFSHLSCSLSSIFHLYVSSISSMLPIIQLIIVLLEHKIAGILSILFPDTPASVLMTSTSLWVRGFIEGFLLTSCPKLKGTGFPPVILKTKIRDFIKHFIGTGIEGFLHITTQIIPKKFF